MRFCVLLTSLLSLSVGCSSPSYDERVDYGGSKEADADLSVAQCSSTTSYAVHPGASITWQVTKLTADGTSTVTGMTSVTGVLDLPKDGWTASKSTLRLAGKNTETGNSLRDQRIDDLIFKTGLFAFELEEIKSTSSRKVGESLLATIKGKLHVAGQVAPIEMPILFNETAGQISITPAEAYKLNVRKFESASNGINLVNQVTDLLKLVPGVEMEDEVTINFNLELNSNCDPKVKVEKLPGGDSSTDKSKDSSKGNQKDPSTETQTETTKGTDTDELPDLTPEKTSLEDAKLIKLGLAVYEERCSKCHGKAEETNHNDLHAGMITDHYTQNFPTHLDVKWPTPEEAYALQKAFE